MRKQIKISSLILAFAVSLLVTACGGGGGGSGAGNIGGTSGGSTSGGSTSGGSTSGGSISLLAGSIGSYGNVDGTGAAARFTAPQTLAIDGTGNLYVSDSNNATVRKITPGGVVTTWTGVPGAAGMALDSAGNMYEADTRDLVILKVTPGGSVTTFAGTKDQSGSTDGAGTAAKFNLPSAVAVDSAGNVYVGDSGNDVIRKISPAGVVSTLSGPLTSKQNATQNATGYIAGLAIDQAGNIYAAEFYFVYTIIDPDNGLDGTMITGAVVHKITPAGVVTDLAGSGSAMDGVDGTGAAATFSGFNGLSIDTAGNLYATGSKNVVRKITPSGVVTTLPGTTFTLPAGVAVDASGNIFVSDMDADTVNKIDTSGTETIFAGAGPFINTGNGSGGAPTFSQPHGLTVDSSGNVYVADYLSGSISKITPAGVTTTVASGGTLATLLDGYDLTVDSSGNLYMPTLYDVLNVITPSGAVSELAGGPGIDGYLDGTGSAARFNYPTGVVLDSANNVYIADTGNSTIRKVTPAGVVTTVAGVPGTHGAADGSGTSATFYIPQALALDSGGNLYVLDAGNNNIRKITPGGTVSTLAGTAGITGSADGTGAAASFNNPVAMAIDAKGNLFVADSNNNAIRKITPAGVVSTVVGSANSQGISLGALPGSLLMPLGVAIDSNGVLYVSSSSAVLKIQLQ